MKIVVWILSLLNAVAGVAISFLYFELREESERTIALSELNLTGHSPSNEREDTKDPEGGVAVDVTRSAPASPLNDTPRNSSAALPASTASKEEASAAKQALVELDDPEQRMSAIAEIRGEMRSRYLEILLAMNLSNEEADALLDILSEALLQRGMNQVSTAVSEDVDPSVGRDEDRQRLLRGERTRKLTELLGTDRYAQFEELEHTQPSRTRVSNLSAYLEKAGRPLTREQHRQLTETVVAEQKRQEREAQVIRDSGQSITQSSRQNRFIEGNRRILSEAALYLDSVQLTLLQSRFQLRESAPN